VAQLEADLPLSRASHSLHGDLERVGTHTIDGVADGRAEVLHVLRPQQHGPPRPAATVAGDPDPDDRVPEVVRAEGHGRLAHHLLGEGLPLGRGIGEEGGELVGHGGMLRLGVSLTSFYNTL